MSAAQALDALAEEACPVPMVPGMDFSNGEFDDDVAMGDKEEAEQEQEDEGAVDDAAAATDEQEQGDAADVDSEAAEPPAMRHEGDEDDDAGFFREEECAPPPHALQAPCSHGSVCGARTATSQPALPNNIDINASCHPSVSLWARPYLLGGVALAVAFDVANWIIIRLKTRRI